ncbi:MAG: (2Fe-2S)-binding protein [Bdellovibrio sp.]
MTLSERKQIVVEMPGRDRLVATPVSLGWTFEVIGCAEITKLVQQLTTQHGADPSAWSLPEGDGHAAMMLRELILRVRGEWAYPYEHLEVCHCRSVATEMVDQAILAGAHTCERVSRRTSASTACGTCRPDVQRILSYRLARDRSASEQS